MMPIARGMHWAFWLPLRDGVAMAQIPGEQGKFRCLVRNGALEAEAAVVHFPLPLRQWYDDIVFT